MGRERMGRPEVTSGLGYQSHTVQLPLLATSESGPAARIEETVKRVDEEPDETVPAGMHHATRPGTPPTKWERSNCAGPGRFCRSDPPW
jgi:hypothetical protein